MSQFHGIFYHPILSGCSLHEPLSTMMTSKSYKTSDVIGYLRSILEHSKPYARLKLMVVGIQGIGKAKVASKIYIVLGHEKY